jgi:hypothetical protein
MAAMQTKDENRLGYLAVAVAAASFGLATATMSCSSDSDSGGSGGDDSPFGNANDRPGAGADGGPGSGNPGSGGPGGPLTPENACGIGNDRAMLAPVNMLVMFDRSGSMEDDDKWPNATAALTAFLEHESAADMRVALRFFPHDEPAEGCSEDECDAVACSQPLVEIAPLTAAPAPMDAHEEALVSAIEDSAPGGEGQGTPIYAALDGALRWATDYKDAHPQDNTVVVFVTDGEPNGCDEDFDNISELAADALAGSGVLTYAIGLLGSSEDQMDQLAEAGGTGQGIFIDESATAERELLDTLNTIRGENLACDFAFPEPRRASEPIDPNHVSVNFLYPNGDPAVQLPEVAGADACGDASGWYYDRPQEPSRIFLCPSACDTARATENAGLQILIGCQTGGGEPLDCAATPDDPACQVE